MQFDGDVPHGSVAVDFLVDAGESAVDGSQACDARSVDALQSTDPEFDVGIHRVFDQNRDVHTFQRVGQFLHGERIGRSACSDPKQIHSGFERRFHMLGHSHFGGYQHAGFFLDALQPG